MARVPMTRVPMTTAVATALVTAVVMAVVMAVATAVTTAVATEVVTAVVMVSMARARTAVASARRGRGEDRALLRGLCPRMTPAAPGLPIPLRYIPASAVALRRDFRPVAPLLRFSAKTSLTLHHVG